jgi:hypothetical protein
MKSVGNVLAKAANQGEHCKFGNSSNGNKPERPFGCKQAFLVRFGDRRGLDIIHRRTREQLSKAVRFLEAGDLNNCRVALHVGLEWAVAAEELRP